ncbi:FHA domain-containing protein [Nocardioides sp. SOB77]|uniref:FHA domain-containing protein n=1 Tax=Nocardioides oceani TaxID=3058369 RepID=A0ABT8FCU6_9ACTN|nr:FHA domain-containing protein [Nocardioides oceani]MDN4172232.1 FHA domain-containing protein [Nocardioides oceani]
MSELTLFLIRVAYLAILWIFVLSAISVIRSDMFGARVPESARGAEPQPRRTGRAGRAGRAGKDKPPAKRRGSPTHVIVTEGSNVGERAELDGAPVLIGRGSDAAIRLDDDYVSTRHARIAASGDQWFVEDLGSTNGTYIGSVRITQPTTVTLGTQVRIGKTILELRK